MAILRDYLLPGMLATKTRSSGTMYKAAGFALHHTVPANYWYVDNDGFVMRKRTLYGSAVRLGMTEAEFAAAHGYVKKYGGEKLCFVYDRRGRCRRSTQH